MKFNFKWLQKYVAVPNDIEKLAESFTESGSEVESIEGEVIDVAVAPNRADCLGMIGLAREAAVISGVNFLAPSIKPIPAVVNEQRAVVRQDASICPEYVCRVINGVDNTKPTPEYIKEALALAGTKSISAIVDITNYVMLEYGQPTHAFDLSKVNGSIVLRKGKAGEKLTLLDESTITLDEDSLVIADEQKALALAGIMGGMDSGISLGTTDILLECAYFEPIAIRMTARKYNIQTDASHRYERNIDYSMQLTVMERLTQLILEVVGGKPGPVVNSTVKHALPEALTLKLRQSRTEKIIGMPVSVEKIRNILQSLGMKVDTTANADELSVAVPAFRPDITREIDLIEEVTRIIGCNSIPAVKHTGLLSFIPQIESLVNEEQIVNCLVNRGFHQAITYSFIDSNLAKLFTNNIEQDWILSNPISSEMNLMRSSLLPGLVQALAYNQNRQQSRIRLFEIGLRFVGDKENLQQIKTISGVCNGGYLHESWANDTRAVDLYDVKADILALFKLGNNVGQINFKACEDMQLQPGQSAAIILNGNVVGMFGALSPQIAKDLDITGPVVVFELDYAAVSQGRLTQFESFSKYPAVRRDIAVLVAQEIAVADMLAAIKSTVANVLSDTIVFDIYQGKGIPNGQKSVGLGLVFQTNERTLTDVEVSSAYDSVLAMLKDKFTATLR